MVVNLVLRPGVLRSRPGAGCLGVSRPAHAQHAHDMRTPCARRLHAVLTSCARSANDLTWCNALFRSLFMGIVHEHCSKGKKKIQIS